MSVEYLLKEWVRLLAEEREFDQWLSSDVVNLLVSAYALSPAAGMKPLSWSYDARLAANTWGEYRAQDYTLYVSRQKTTNRFKQQVNTILHEIQHWNQHVVFFESHDSRASGSDAMARLYDDAYQRKKAYYGYWNHPDEVDARKFADEHEDEAIAKIGRHYGGKIDGSTLDSIVEELFDEYVEEGELPLTRLKIGSALKNADLNNAENLKFIVDELRGLGVTVR